MSGRKAKALRRIAEKVTVGMPVHQFEPVVWLQRRLGSTVVHVPAPIHLERRTTRAFYQHLKRKFINQQPASPF